MTKPRPTKRELAAMGYALADEIETRAAALRKKRPDMTREASINATIEKMAA